jgi:hypothetical protein
VQFDNTHLTRDRASVPSELEQMPHLLNFIRGNGTMMANDHTILISRTAGGFLSSFTGLYPDRHGQTVTDRLVGSAVRLGTVGSGLPTAAGQTITNLPGFATSTGSPYAFFFADLDPTTPGLDTLYVVDDAAGLTKYSLVSNAWVSNGTVGVATDAYRGLTDVVTGTTVTLYTTRKGGTSATGGGELATITDASGFNAALTGTPTLLATAIANTAFRGVALAPRP